MTVIKIETFVVSILIL